ncbi:hypothetical protein D3C86_1242630 [compost metagenome]
MDAISKKIMPSSAPAPPSEEKVQLPDPLLNDSISALIRIWAFVCEHPGIAGTATIAFGALTLLTYYLPLGFIPDFDLSSVTGVLLIAALLGAVQIFWLGAALVLPAIISAGNIFKPESGKDYKWLLTVYISTVLWLIAYWRGAVANEKWFVFGLPVVLSVGLVLAIFRKTKPAGGYALIAGIQGVVCVVAALLFQPAPQSSISQGANWLQWLFLVLWCLLVTIANTVLWKEGRPTLRAVLGVTAYLLFTLILMTQNLGYVHGAAVRMLSLGDVRGVLLTVNDTGAAVLSAACQGDSPPTGCAPQKIIMGEAKAYAYRNITILSRIGSQYYLQLCAADDKGGACDTVEGLRIVVDKRDVLGWSSVGARLKNSEESGEIEPVPPRENASEATS